MFVGLPAYLQRRLQAVLNAAARLVFQSSVLRFRGLRNSYIGCFSHDKYPGLTLTLKTNITFNLSGILSVIRSLGIR